VKDAQNDAQKDANAPRRTHVSDDAQALAAQARESVEKSAAELRKHRVPITIEPPTVYRP